MYDNLHLSINTFVEKQIASMLKTKKSEIQVHIMDMQMQAGTCDCGLYAIATATALLSGVHPGNTPSTRHLYTCLNEGKIGQFPLQRRRRGGNKIKYYENFSVYGDCKMPECPGREMVECSVCLEWFHIECLQDSVPVGALQDEDVEWLCHRCLCKELKYCRILSLVFSHSLISLSQLHNYCKYKTLILYEPCVVV